MVLMLLVILNSTKTDKITAMKEIVSYIYENEVCNYADFLMYCIATSDEWFDVAISTTLAINKMIDAVWHKKKS